MKKIILTGNTDNDKIRSDWKRRSIFDSYQQTLTDPIMLFTDLREELAVDVLIVEDDVEYILKYFKALESFEGAQTVVACTKSYVVFHLLQHFLKRSHPVKLVLFDFNLNEHGTDPKLEVQNARNLYEYIEEYLVDKLGHEFALLAITGFEGSYEELNFRELETDIKAVSQWVVNKKFADKPEILSELLLKNIGLLDPNIRDPKREREKVRSLAAVATPPPPPIDPDRQERARDLAIRIQDAIRHVCPDRQRFMPTLHSKAVKKKSTPNEGYADHRNLAQEVKRYADVFNQVILKDQAFADFRYQVERYGLWRRNGVRII